MVDKVKPLKLESSATGGTENDMFPTEVNPAEDYVSGKGFTFEHSDDYLLDKIGGVIMCDIPNSSSKVVYSGDNISYVEFYKGAVQTTPNRIARIDLTYSGDFVQSESLKIYSLSDGTTVLKTVTTTYTYTGDDVTSAAVS